MIDSLNGFLELDLARRETLWLAVEPGGCFVDLLGIASLLPSEGLGEKLSFSTYGSHADRLATVLAATQFHDPEIASDLPQEAYQSLADFAINTYNDKRSAARRLCAPAPLYAKTLVDSCL